MASTTQAPLTTQARSLYRALLRELPRRPLSSPSPLKLRIRGQFASPPTSSSREQHHHQRRLQHADQVVRYARAQRMYATLLERYNPGVNMDQEERIRLTARRVGMELPVETDHQSGSSGSDSGSSGADGGRSSGQDGQ